MNPQVPVAANPGVSRGRVVGVCLVLAAITFAVFGQTLHHQFVNFDDGEYVAKNPMVAQGLTLQGLVWAFAAPHSANWHPITWLSHMLDCELYGLDPGGHHLTNVLLHAGTAIALFLALLRMTGSFWRSAFVAAVFAIHPLRAESVAWVSERKDVLSGFFFFLTLWAYARYAASVASSQWSVVSSSSPKSKVQNQRSSAAGFRGPDHSALRIPHSALWYALALLCFTLGLMSKPMLVTLPLVLLLLDYWPLGRLGMGRDQRSEVRGHNANCDDPTIQQSTNPSIHPPSSILRHPSTTQPSTTPALRLVLEKLPFLALSAVSSLVTLLAQRSAMKSFESFPLAARMGGALLSCKVYLVQMIYPAGLASFYPFPLHASARSAAMAGLLLLVISAIAWQERRTRPWIITGWLWYLVMLLPVLGLVQVGGQAHADRYTYLPQIGIYVAVTWLAADLAAQWRLGRLPVGAVMAVIVTVLMASAWQQTAYWKNSEILWRHALDCTTGNNLAYVNLGHELFEQRRLDEVISHYQKGLETQPNNRQFHNNLANALREQGKLDEAIVHYQRAAQIDPSSSEAQFNLGKALGLKGKHEEAIARYESALQIEPTFLPALMSLGTALLQQGKPDLAAPHFQKVLVLRPHDAAAHLNLGLCLYQIGKMGDARLEYENALQFAPGDPGIQNNLAWLLATCPEDSLRDGSRAVQLAEQANALTGGSKPLILRTLAAALAEAGRFPEAVETAQRASSLAEAQSLTDMARQIQLELDFYRTGKPFRFPKQAP